MDNKTSPRPPTTTTNNQTQTITAHVITSVTFRNQAKSLFIYAHLQNQIPENHTLRELILLSEIATTAIQELAHRDTKLTLPPEEEPTKPPKKEQTSEQQQ
jgi:hypothetical protein